MLKRKIELPPLHLYPADEWRIVEARYSDEFAGFGGVRDFGGRLSFASGLPHAWYGLAFSLRFGGRQIRVRLTHDEESYLIEEGARLNVLVRGEPHLLSPGTAVAIKLPAAMTGTLRAVFGFQRGCPGSARARGWRRESLVVSASGRFVA